MLRALARLLPYVRRTRFQVIAGLLSILAATALSLASPWLLKDVIDGLSGGLSRRQLALYAAAMLGLALADGWFRYTMRRLLIGASRQIEYDLRNDFFAHLEHLPLAYFQANRTGDLMSRATNDLGAVRMMVGPAVMYFGSTALGFVIAIALMAAIDWRLTLVALLPLPGVTIATHYFGRAIHDRFERIQAQLSELSAVVQEALAGVRVVRAYRQEGFELARFREANDEYVRRNRGLIRLQAGFYPSLTLCFGLSGLLVLWFGGRDVIAGRLTLGAFVAFMRYLVLLSWPLIAFGWVINIVQRGIASWERMLEVLDAPAAGAGEGAAPSQVPITGRLDVTHLTFRYPGAPGNALEDVSLSLAPGRTVALVGATGSGKSTLVQLLPRLHEPPPGTVWVDGTDVRAMPLDQLRRAIGVVPQEPFLFSDTVGGNVGFGLDDAPDQDAARARITEAVATAGLSTDIAGFTHGLDTVVGERGITLSGGQKQRVAIARALAIDPRILILDDALSAVDTATEEAILRQLQAIRRSRACLIVSHRVSTVRDADEIVVLGDGRVVERGTHDALVAAGGVYADMHRRQLLEEEMKHWRAVPLR
ncbi:MAG: ABC transporter ATP-binding protein [Vicinamibacterales bacterium]